jgi:hypothetical protein
LGEGLRGKCALGRTLHKSLRLTELGPAETASPCGAHAAYSAKRGVRGEVWPCSSPAGPFALSAVISNPARDPSKGNNFAPSAHPASGGILTLRSSSRCSRGACYRARPRSPRTGDGRRSLSRKDGEGRGKNGFLGGRGLEAEATRVSRAEEVARRSLLARIFHVPARAERAGRSLYPGPRGRVGMRTTASQSSWELPVARSGGFTQRR